MMIRFTGQTIDTCASPTRRLGGGAHLLIVLCVLALFGLSLASCSRPVTDDTLRQAAETFWQTQQNGQWHQSWAYFSPQALARLRAQQPEVFTDADHYASERARWALKHPYKEIRILSVAADPKTRSGLVTLEVQIRGQNDPRQISQRWIYDSERKWLIDAAPAPVD